MYKITGIYAYRTRRRTESVPCTQIASDTTEITLKFRSPAAGFSICVQGTDSVRRRVR